MSKNIAIIILNYNGKKYLPDCLSSLNNIDYPQENYKVIFVDNDSTDDSIEYVRNNFPHVKIMKHEKNFGFAQGNNIAIQRMLEKGYDYILLLNQDTIVEKDFLTKLIKVAESDDKIGALQPRIMLYPDKDQVNSMGNSIHYLGFGFSSGGYQEFNGDIKPHQIAYASGACLLLRVQVLEEVGLFDSDFFMYHEDLDLGWRIRMAGYKILVVPDSVIFHKFEFSKSLKKYYYMERNRFITVLENYKLATLALITPACIVMEMGLFLFAIKSGFALEKLKVYAYFLNPVSWLKIFRHRLEKNKIRKVNDKDIIKFFTGKIQYQEIDNIILKKIANPIFNLYWRFIRFFIFW